MNRLQQMNLRLAEIEEERSSIQKQVQALETSLTRPASGGLLRHVTLATASALAVTSLLTIGYYQNAFSNVQIKEQVDDSLITTRESGQIVRSVKAQHRISKKTHYARSKAASQHQWGPSLLMPEPDAKKHHYGFDPLVKQQQKDLLALGFSVGEADGFKGADTQRAIAEFRALYLPKKADQLKDNDLAVIMDTYANLARRDAGLYGIDQGIVAAIRLSSVRTGVDFSYLMKLAATESNFKPASEAATSSATGMYQFTHDTWLKTVKTYGANYGLVADYADNIEYYTTRSGRERAMVQDKSIYRHLLALRKNPRLSAIMAAETVRDNQQKLVHSLHREPTETDLYLTHFLGTDEAISFLQSLKKSPGKYADELFPAAASSNHDIFYPRTCAARTVDEVYSHFGEKFSTRRYDDVSVDISNMVAAN